MERKCSKDNNPAIIWSAAVAHILPEKFISSEKQLSSSFYDKSNGWIQPKETWNYDRRALAQFDRSISRFAFDVYD